jgi:hypothetical protein
MATGACTRKNRQGMHDNHGMSTRSVHFMVIMQVCARAGGREGTRAVWARTMAHARQLQNEHARCSFVVVVHSRTRAGGGGCMAGLGTGGDQQRVHATTDSISTTATE